MKVDNTMNDIFTDQPRSYWIASTPETDYPSLEEDVQADVAIVGGGMVGITSALLLKEEGLKVAVIEADRILLNTTGHTTAKLTSQHTLIYDKIKNQIGKEKAQQYADANESAIHMVAKMIKEKNIECDFEWQSAYVYTQSDKYVEKIENEAKTASDLGIQAFYQQETPLPFKVKAALRYDNQAQFHPRKYLLALAKEIPGDGSHIFEMTRAVEILQQGQNYSVMTAKGKKVIAPSVIIASHYPFYNLNGLYFARIYAERSYVLGVKIKEEFPGGMYINAESPTRSLRYQPYKNGQLVLVVGEHHKTGQGINTIEHYKNLRDFAQEIYTVKDIPYRWSTQDCMTMDDIPYVGHYTADTPNLYVATGFGKWGMTNSTASAMILRDLIVKGDSPWAPVYSPSRFNPKGSAVNYIVENANVAKELVTGKITPVPSDLDVENGQAKVVEVDGRRVGAYRDEEGKLHLVDTTCTHMRCELQWNAAEKSWDCPCHGSRFTYTGKIVEGPATKPLKNLIEEAQS